MEPGTRPAYKTSDGSSVTVPMVTVTPFNKDAAPVAIWPAGTEGFVSPNPVPYNVTISPGLAGMAPGIRDRIRDDVGGATELRRDTGGVRE